MRLRQLVAFALPCLVACQSGESTDVVASAMELGPEVPADRAVIGGTGLESEGADIAWSGSQYLAVWMQESVAFGPSIPRATRIASDGTVLDDGGIDLLCEDCPGPPRTASFQDGYLVVVREFGPILVRRVAEDGTVTPI